jgi:anti-sigma factor (TIGR02949 family)
MKSDPLHFIDCDALVAQLWDYLDGELSPDRVRALEAHLADCSQCTGHVHFERTVLNAIRHARHDAVDPERLTTRVRHALAAAGLSDPR